VSFHQAAFAREPVPGARRQAIVAPVNAVADGRAQLDRDRAFELDGQIGNAAARIDLERRSDGGGRAGGDAPDAGAAAIFLGRIRVKFERRDDFRQEQPVAEASADEIRVLADKSQPGALREVAFQNRPGVHVP